jgi:hypothetical protein
VDNVHNREFPVAKHEVPVHLWSEMASSLQGTIVWKATHGTPNEELTDFDIDGSARAHANDGKSASGQSRGAAPRRFGQG